MGTASKNCRWLRAPATTFTEHRNTSETTAPALLHVALLAPDEPADVEVVVQDARSPERMAANGDP